MTTANPSLSSQIVLPQPFDDHEREIFESIARRDSEIAERIEEVDSIVDRAMQIIDAREYGVSPDTTAAKNDAAISDILDDLHDGSIVWFPEGVIEISQTLVIGDATGTTKSTYSNVTFRGAGLTRDSNLMYSSKASTAFKWTGVSGGKMMEVNGPIQGVQLFDFGLDCNGGLGATGIESIRSFTEYWRGITIWGWDAGYAIEINANRAYTAGGLGGADAPQESVYDRVRTIDPYGTSGAHSLRIGHAQTFLGNVNELRFYSCAFERGDHDSAVGIDLGYCDHITFFGCWGLKRPSTGSGIGIQVSPQGATTTAFPHNIYFVACHPGGGVNHNTTYTSWVAASRAAIYAYPWPTTDNLINHMPPTPATGGSTLPDDMVQGYTDRGIPLFEWESRIIIASATAIANTTVLTAFDKTLTLKGADAWRDGQVFKIKAGGVYSTTGTPTIDISIYAGTQAITQTQFMTCQNNAINMAWFVEGTFCTRPSSVAAILPGFGAVSTFLTTTGLPVLSTLGGTFGWARASLTITVKVEWSVADAANSIVMDYFQLECEHPLPER